VQAQGEEAVLAALSLGNARANAGLVVAEADGHGRFVGAEYGDSTTGRASGTIDSQGSDFEAFGRYNSRAGGSIAEANRSKKQEAGGENHVFDVSV
jgi:hypothetical protein